MLPSQLTFHNLTLPFQINNAVQKKLYTKEDAYSHAVNYRNVALPHGLRNIVTINDLVGEYGNLDLSLVEFMLNSAGYTTEIIETTGRALRLASTHECCGLSFITVEKKHYKAYILLETRWWEIDSLSQKSNEVAHPHLLKKIFSLSSTRGKLGRRIMAVKKGPNIT